MAGEKSGITGMEFPILNYLMFLCDEAFGFTHWYGRLINLIFSTLGVWFFFLIVRRFFDAKIALYAMLLLSCSLWFLFSRKSMPDTFAVSLLLGALWMAVMFLSERNRFVLKDAAWLALFVLLLLAGLLSKIPAGAVIAPIVLLLFIRNVPLWRKLLMVALFMVCLIPVYWWYYIWSPRLTADFGFTHFFMGNDMAFGLKSIVQNPAGLARQFYFISMRVTGFVAFLVGLFFMIKSGNRRLIWVVVLSFLAFSVVIIMGGNTFIRHSYYMIPVVSGYRLNSFS